MPHAGRHHKPVHLWIAVSDLTVAERVERCITVHEGVKRASLAGKPGDRVRVCQSPGRRVKAAGAGAMPRRRLTAYCRRWTCRRWCEGCGAL